MMPHQENFDVVFDVKMPGAQKKTPYTISVKADSRGDALAIAEAKWQEITGQYDVRVISVATKPASPAGTTAESQKEG
jgi:hypothetical protein